MLEGKGFLVRKRRTDQMIGNYPSEVDVVPPGPSRPAAVNNHVVEALSEDEIKQVLAVWLRADGASFSVSWTLF